MECENYWKWWNCRIFPSFHKLGLCFDRKSHASACCVYWDVPRSLDTGARLTYLLNELRSHIPSLSACECDQEAVPQESPSGLCSWRLIQVESERRGKWEELVVRGVLISSQAGGGWPRRPLHSLFNNPRWCLPGRVYWVVRLLLLTLILFPIPDPFLRHVELYSKGAECWRKRN